ncbi:MAG: MGMT family protein [Patescibacteria group bacterium]
MTVTNFQKRVYRLTALIPRGRVATYLALAKALGQPGASRAVGNALHNNPYAPQVPCHRVIRSDGTIGGFAGGAAKKIALLKKEGVSIKTGRISSTEYLYGFKIKR